MQIGKWGGSICGAERASKNQPLGEGASLAHLPRHFGGEEPLKLPNRCRQEFTYFHHTFCEPSVVSDWCYCNMDKFYGQLTLGLKIVEDSKALRL